MSLSFRNLLLFALFVALVSSLSISHNAHRNQNQHMVKVHESTTKFSAHQQSSTNFGQNILATIDAIAKSVQPDTPSIISTSSLTTFAYDRSTCESLTDDQKKQISDKVKSTKDSIASFKGKVTDNKLLADADNSNQYLDTVQKLSSSDCSTFTKYLLIGPTPYQTNINTDKSWILGGITMDDLVKDYINRITVNNNVTNCGNDTPFWNGFKCVACNDPKPIFNITARDCIACPSGKVFDLKTRTCVDGQAPAAKSWKPNPAAEANALVPADASKDALPNYMNTGSDVCPVDKPFVKDNTCIACPSDKPYFNIVSKACEPCPNGSVFSSTTHQCAPADKVYKPNPAAEANALVPDGAPADALSTYLNSGSEVCPADKPNVKDNTCIACPADKPYFNIITKNCEPCPADTTFDPATHKCVGAAKQYKPNAAAEANALVPDGAPADALPTYMNTGKQPCPADKPFVKDNVCIPCPEDKPYFNIIAKECQPCPQDTVFDSATHKCIPGKPIATNVPVYNPRLVMNDNSTNTDWDNYVKENQNKILCPADKPFWNDTECIQCPDLFNVIEKKCASCEPGLTLSTDTHKCEPAARIEPSLKDLFNAIF